MGTRAYILVLFASAAIAAGADQLYIKSDNGVNLRATPNGRDVGGIPYGVSVNIEEISGKWARVSFEGQEGWVYTPNAEIRGGSAPVAEDDGTVPTPVAADARTMIVTGNDVRFRIAPSDDIISQLDRGARVRVLGEARNGWAQVEWNGIPGYMSDDYLRAATADETDIPTAPELEIDVNTYGNMRAGPSLDSARIGKFSDGARVHVVGKPEGEWIPVRTASGVFGYIHESLVSSGSSDALDRARAYAEAAGIDSAPIGVLVLGGDQPSDSEAGFQCLECSRSGGVGFSNPFGNTGGVGFTSDKGYVLPISGGRISSWFGPRNIQMAGASTNHKGIDIAVPEGTPVLATKGGVVERAYTGCRKGTSRAARTCNGKAGNVIRIVHPDGTRSRYFHLLDASVREGQRVEAGQVIGRVGTTGNSSGPHLHFEIQVRRGGGWVSVDPVQYLMN